MTATELEALLTPSQAARLAGVSSHTIVRLANDKRLASHRTAYGRLFEREAVEAFRREREARQA